MSARIGKRAGSLLLLALTALALAFAVRAWSSCTRLRDHLASAAELDEIAAARREADEPLLLDFTLDGYALPQDELARRFYVSLPADGDPLEAIVRVSGRTPGVYVAVEDAPIDEALLQSARELRMIAYTDNAYTEYRLSLTTLPLMVIDCGQTIGGEAVPAEVTLYDNRPGAERRVVRSLATIHVRGITTALFEKKGYRISLVRGTAGSHARENDLPLLGMRADGDWLLYSCYDDHEKVRSAFSSRLWYDGCAANNAFGLQNGTYYEFVEVLLDERYWGLYAMRFPIDAKQQSLARNEMICKLNRWWDPLDPAFDEYEGEENVFTVTRGQALCGPADAPNPLRRYGALFSGGDAGFDVDMDNEIDFFLFNVLTQNVDSFKGGALKNTVFTFKGDPSRYTMLCAPWDLNFTWGNDFLDRYVDEYLAPYALSPQDNVVMERSPVYLALSQGDAALAARVRDRWAELRAGAWSDESVLALIDECEAAVFGSGAYAREQARWPEGSYIDGEPGLDTLREYAQARLVCMDAWVDALCAAP